eukprot:4718358-Prymnesium_polylepis.1
MPRTALSALGCRACKTRCRVARRRDEQPAVCSVQKPTYTVMSPRAHDHKRGGWSHLLWLVAQNVVTTRIHAQAARQGSRLHRVWVVAPKVIVRTRAAVGGAVPPHCGIKMPQPRPEAAQHRPAVPIGSVGRLCWKRVEVDILWRSSGQVVRKPLPPLGAAEDVLGEHVRARAAQHRMTHQLVRRRVYLAVCENSQTRLWAACVLDVQQVTQRRHLDVAEHVSDAVAATFGDVVENHADA